MYLKGCILDTLKNVFKIANFKKKNAISRIRTPSPWITAKTLYPYTTFDHFIAKIISFFKKIDKRDTTNTTI